MLLGGGQIVKDSDMFGRVIHLFGEHVQANGKLKNEWKNTKTMGK